MLVVNIYSDDRSCDGAVSCYLARRIIILLQRLLIFVLSVQLIFQDVRYYGWKLVGVLHRCDVAKGVRGSELLTTTIKVTRMRLEKVPGQ